MLSHRTSALTSLLAVILLTALAFGAVAAPSGPPIKIGGTLALTGPLAATALLHKITAEIYVEELNRNNGLLGRPVEWIVLDDQSKPEVTRSLYEKLITVDKVDLLMGPYATGGIIAAMGVAQRYQKLLIHHSFGMPHLAKYDMQFPAAPFGPEPNKTVPGIVDVSTDREQGGFQLNVKIDRAAASRYGVRVQAYTGLLTDQYPPFSLHAG